MSGPSLRAKLEKSPNREGRGQRPPPSGPLAARPSTRHWQLPVATKKERSRAIRSPHASERRPHKDQPACPQPTRLPRTHPTRSGSHPSFFNQILYGHTTRKRLGALSDSFHGREELFKVDLGFLHWHKLHCRFSAPGNHNPLAAQCP